MSRSTKDQKEMMINFKVKQSNNMVMTMLSPDTFGRKEQVNFHEQSNNVPQHPAPANPPPPTSPINKDVWQFHNESFPNQNASPAKRFCPPAMEKNNSTPSLPVQPPYKNLLVQSKQQSSAPDVLSKHVPNYNPVNVNYPPVQTQYHPQYAQNMPIEHMHQNPNFGSPIYNNAPVHYNYVNQPYSQYGQGSNNNALPPIQSFTQNFIPDQRYHNNFHNGNNNYGYQTNQPSDGMDIDDNSNSVGKMAISNLIL